MKLFQKQWIWILLVSTSLILLSCNRPVVSLENLLDEMTDRENITRYPEVSFTLGQFSSYDRESVAPGRPGWFANMDRTMFIRVEEHQGRTEHVMVDTRGPGAIVRIWMTFAGNEPGRGILRIYFDDNPVPVIEGAAVDILSGGALVGEPLASSVSDLSPYDNRGHNLYLPMPYTKSCKITYESRNITNPGNKGNTGESVYYNINYRTYPETTKAETFSMDVLARAGKKLAEVQREWMNRERDRDLDRCKVREIHDTLLPGDAWTTELKGSGVIKFIKLKLNASHLPRALRTAILEMHFDGEQTVWCPAGDFFGTGYQCKTVNTWYTAVDEDGTMAGYWLMPFEKEARLVISNIGDQEMEIMGELGWESYKWDDRSMHFGVSWHQYTSIFTREGLARGNPGSPFDLNFVELDGKGLYVGDGLVLFNTAYIWWGEGDEKIYVDGEAFPSHFGTGTEDYYGYAWGGRSKPFSNHPLIAQPDAGGNARPGYVVNLRYRGLDVIPFREGLTVDMELWHWHSTWINYAPVCYFYLRPGGKSNIAPDREGALAKVALHSTDIIDNTVKDGMIEAEHMPFYNSCGNKRGSMIINPLDEVALSGHLQVLWNDGMPGDTISFSFISEKEGVFQLTGDFPAGPAFGKFICCLNGAPVGKEFSLTAGKREIRTIPLGKVTLNEGSNILSFVVRPGDRKSHFFALDRLKMISYGQRE